MIKTKNIKQSIILNIKYKWHKINKQHSQFKIYKKKTKFLPLTCAFLDKDTMKRKMLIE